MANGLLDFLQGASNAAAANVSAPVDGLTWLLNKLGADIKTPVGGSDWMRERGLTAEPTNKLAGILGESVGGVLPMVTAAKAPQIAQGLLQAERNLAAPRTLNPQTGAILWHGSPHKFDAFDSSKIGTGEGAQAYGHGLYLADNQGVAKSYGVKGAAGGSMPTPPTPTDFIIDRQRFFKDDGKLFRQVGDSIYPVDKAEYGEALRAAQEKFSFANNAGNLYKVDLPDEHIAKMLDWDKPLSKQSPEVQKAADKLVGDRLNSLLEAQKSYGITNKYDTLTGEELIRGLQSKASNTSSAVAQRDALIAKYQNKNMSWADAVRAMTPEDRAKFSAIANEIDSTKNAPSYVSNALKDAGIPGIRYLDGGSRGTGAGTSNYVVFPGNEGLLSILERNGQPLK